MKVKKYIGKTINGFQIIDTYPKLTENGKKTRKVLLRCEDCGRMFERGSGVDFEHIKCKCKCADYGKQPRQYHLIEYDGKVYKMTDLCREKGIPTETFRVRIKNGLSVEEALSHEFTNTCVICNKEFTSKIPNKKYCSPTCVHRAAKGKGPYKQPHIAECVVCGRNFETIRDDVKTCSKACRYAVNNKKRKAWMRDLRNSGRYDRSISLDSVYDKFGGVCNKCHKATTFDTDYNGDDYPTIDHVIPLSRGGVHEWDNVQLLCRKCNVLKKAKVI